MIKRSILRPILCYVALTTVLVANAAAQDADTDPPLPGNPITRMISGLNPANWTMPKMPTMSTFLPTKQEKDRVITKKNSLVTEVSDTAKTSWRRTKETLNPMRLIPAGFKQDSEVTPAAKPKQQGGFFSSLFAPFPAEEDPETKPSVTDFLKQDPIR